MYTSFVLACNYALDKLSEINVEGLPAFEPRKQIVFFRNHGRSVHSDHHNRKSLVGPDILLLQWDLLLKRRDPNSSDSNIHSTPYSTSYSTDLCVEKSDLEFSWRNIRSTLEMKIGKLPGSDRWTPVFDKGFGALNETMPCVSFDEGGQPAFVPAELPAGQCECPPLR